MSLRRPASIEERESRDADVIARRRAGDHPTEIAAALELPDRTVRKILHGVADLPPVVQVEKARGATRTCPDCGVKFPSAEWALHLTEAHGRTGKVGRAQSSLERYIAALPPAGEPQRPPEPPCRVCRRTPCEAPLAHAQRIRAQDQHAARIVAEQERKKAA